MSPLEYIVYKSKFMPKKKIHIPCFDQLDKINAIFQYKFKHSLLKIKISNKANNQSKSISQINYLQFYSK
jgi:hypothetical protein